MDPDFAVLCAMQRAPLDGPAAWARSAKQDVSSVRRRIKRFQDQGLLLGFSAIPRPEVFERTYAPYTFQCPDADMTAVMAIPDVAWAVKVHNGTVFVIAYESGVSRRAALEGLLGPMTSSFEHDNKADDPILGRMDLKILRELIIDPRASVTELVNRTRLSSKTVRKHRAELVANKTVAIAPILRPPTTPGRLYFNLSVHGYERPPLVESDNAMTLDTFTTPPASYLLATAANFPEQAAFLQQLENREDVESVNLMVTEDYHLARERMVRWCEKRLEEWEKARLGSTA